MIDIASREVVSFLQRHGLNREATPLRLEGSNRRYYRVSGSENSGLSSAVLCIQSPFLPESDDFLSIREQMEIQGLPVPEIIDLDPALGLMLQTDGGTFDLETALPSLTKAQVREIYFTLIDSLIAMQSIPLKEPVAGRHFDKEKLYWEMEFLFERLERMAADKGLDILPSFELKMFLLEACEALAVQKPEVFAHRDLHSRNILLKDPGESPSPQFTIIDFQDARAGNRFYDLASLVFDPYASLSSSLRTEIIDYYFRRMELEKGRGMLYLQGLQRVLKALGSYLYLGGELHKPGYLECVSPALQQLEVCLHLGRFPDSVFLFLLDCRKKLLPALDL